MNVTAVIFPPFMNFDYFVVSVPIYFTSNSKTDVPSEEIFQWDYSAATSEFYKNVVS